LGSVAFAIALVSCGGGSAASPATADDGGAGPGDAGTGGPGPGGGELDGASGDGGNRAPPGTLLTQGDVTILGVTTDGHVLCTSNDGSSTNLEVVDVAMKQATVLVQNLGPDDFGMVDGKVIAYWTGVTSGVGTLHIWTPASGMKEAGAGSLRGVFAASSDGSRIAYSTNTSDQGLTTITVGNPALNPPSTDAFPNVGQGTQQDPCAPSLGFVGTRLFVSICLNTSTSPSIRTTSATDVNTTLVTNCDGTWSASAAGDRVFVIAGGNNQGESRTVPGNTNTNIEQSTDEGWLTSDGSKTIYRTTANALKSASTTAPVSATLLVQGVSGLLAKSADDKYALVFAHDPDNTNPSVTRTDLQLASIMAAAPLTALLEASTGLPVGFTSTSTHVVYLTDVSASGSPVGDLRARPVSGGAEIVIAQQAVLPRLVKGTAKVAFADNLQQVGNGGVVGDLKVADLAAGAQPKLVMDGADVAYDLDDTNLYYTLPQQGLFYKPLP
jgi:hypothetical protein